MHNPAEPSRTFTLRYKGPRPLNELLPIMSPVADDYGVTIYFGGRAEFMWCSRLGDDTVVVFSEGRE